MSKKMQQKTSIALVVLMVIACLQFTPLTAYAEEADRNITTNLLETYNTSFEGVDGSGNLYWWNDAAWSQVNIPRTEYGSDPKPSSDCGDYYVLVKPASDGATPTCQVGNADMAGIIESGKTYEYSYYAKLGAGETDGAVQMVVTGAVSDWSSSNVATVTPDKDVTLSATEWTKVTGTFVLADSMEQVQVKFTGTDGITFCLDDFRVAEVIDRNITSNLIESYNSSFEGVDGSGNLYWWNDAAWSQVNIPRTEYGSDPKPSSDCGDYYVLVKPASDGATPTCQVGNADMASIIESGKTYEYSYYAKLGAGETAGAVQMVVTGAVSDWSSSNVATVTPDKDVTLSATEWTKVTGTFVLADSMEQVQVKFTGTDGITFCLDDVRIGLASGSGSGEITYGDNIVINPYFDPADLSMWNQSVGNSSISSVTGTVDGTDITTYGKIDRDPATSTTQDCFAQDITEAVKDDNGAEYQFEFWAMLSDDYVGAPAEQRKIEFLPYRSQNGLEPEYYGSYSSSVLTGDSSLTLEPGVWTKYSGTFKIAWQGELDKVVIRIAEQGTNYGSGDCVLGDYFVTGVSLKKINKPKIEIEKDIPDWKDVITNGLGSDAIAGAAIGAATFTDETLMELTTKHFNAISIENELKPDAILGASPKLDGATADIGGTTIEVPTLNFNNAKGILDYVKQWNIDNPNDQIKVRGHVLVWHSQTPEWFFHEDYDASKPYVLPDEMNLRLEWYIKTVLTHYTTEYPDMFYGWDVVNEAISDGTNTYRKASESSSWAAVYGDQSNEFILNAFVYANKYAPSYLELYYNDYNECVAAKCAGIVELLKAVKGTPGARIDGMGMQGHHGMDSPTVSQIESAVRAYAAVVGKVQVTELDLKASKAYDGTDATRGDEYTKQAYRYKDIYECLVALDNEDGIDVSGITMWGVIDKYSWLNDTNSVGGASDGGPQCPLLFDDNYQSKPAYWAFVNPDVLEPATQKVTVIQYMDDTFSQGKEYAFSQGDTKVTFIPMWDENGLKVKVDVADANVDSRDCITIYVDPTNSKSEDISIQRAATVQKIEVKRSEATATADGYKTVVDIPLDVAVMTVIGFDMAVTDNDNVAVFNDLKKTQETSSKYYAEATMKPYATIHKGTVKIDADVDAEWDDVIEVPLDINLGAQVNASAKLLWDENYLYVLAKVKDLDLNKDSADAYQQDSLEVFIDENNNKSDSYEEDDKQYRINYENAQSFNGTKCIADNVFSATALTDDGYIVEAAFKWTDVAPKIGDEIGIELQINDADSSGVRIGTVSWYDDSGMGWSSPGVYGTMLLDDVAAKEDDSEENTTEDTTENNQPSGGGEGNSQASTEAPTTTEATGNGNQSTDGNDPGTGDSTPIAVLVVVMLLAGAGCVIIKKKRI